MPESAANILEHSTDSFPSDFLDCMSAHITEDEYYLYIERLNTVESWLTPLKPAPDQRFMGFSGAPDWWNPPAPNSSTYYRKEGYTVEIVRFYDGVLYYMTWDT